MKNFLLCLAFCSFSSLYADIADVFPKIGCEKEVVKDETTGRTITYLTSGEFMNCHNYPHNRSWLENEQYILVESSRPRADGTYNGKPGSESPHFICERQLLAINVSTGNIYHLDTLEMEDYSLYPGHLPISSQYHADYSPVTNTLIYSDMTGHKLYLLDLNTGKKNCIWHLRDGTFDNVPAMSKNGKVAIVFVAYPGPAKTDLLYGRTTVAFRLDIQGIQLEKDPSLLYSFTDLIDPADGRRIAPCHPDINPVDPKVWDFCRGFLHGSDGTVLKSRTWWGKTDGSMIAVTAVTPKNRIFTHEIWGPKGQFIYYVDIPSPTDLTGGVSRIDPRIGKPETIFEGLLPRCLHITLDENENRIVYETQSYTKDNPLDEYNNHLEWLGIFNMKTKKHTRILRFLEGRDHPRQAHPAINGDGTKVAFTTADGYNSRVAIIDVGEID